MNVIRLILFSIISLVMFQFTSCNNKPVVQENKPQVVIEEELPSPIFTAEEKAYINEFKKDGYISVASLLSPGNLEISNAGNYSGFQYEMALEFAKFLDLELKIEPVLFEEVFSIDGSIPDILKIDSTYTYTPDIFRKADIFAGFLTILPWRLQIMEMISYIPVREILVSRKAHPIEKFSDLNGKTVGFTIGTSYENTLKNLIDEKKASFSIKHYPFEEDLMSLLNDGKIDALVSDSQKLFLTLKDYPDLVAELPVSDIENVAWGIEKGNTILKEIIRKFFKHTREEKIMNQLFKKQFSIDLKTYFDLIGFENLELYELNLTAGEMKWLNEKRQSGILTMATVEQEETYIVREDGSITGFDFELMSKIAETLGLKLNVSVQEKLSNFFTKDGVFNQEMANDTNLYYTPDLLKEVDIYAAAFAIAPWRERLMTFIPELPVGLILAGREGEEIDHITGLDGKRVAVSPGAFQETMITQMMEEEGFKVDFVYLNTNDNPFEIIKEKKADYQLDGAVYLARGMQSMEGISASPINFGLFTIGIAVKKEDTALASILEKYISVSRADGSFGRLWTKNNGVDFDFYLNLIKE